MELIRRADCSLLSKERSRFSGKAVGSQSRITIPHSARPANSG